MLRDVAIVTLGILLAFALDSWWQGRREAALERAHLAALRGDFEVNAERLRALVLLEERIAESSRRLLALSRQPDGAPTDSVFRLVHQVFNSSRFEPVLGAYEAVVSTGGLTQIRDDSLRAALAEFSSMVSGRYYERFADEVYLSFVRDYVGRLGFAYGSELRDGDAGAGSSAPAAAPAAAAETAGWSPDALLGDPKFEEYLALRFYVERDVARVYGQLADRAEWIRDRLAARLAP